MSTSVGQQLRQAREALSLTIDQVANATRIRPHYLQAMELDNFGALPSTAHARGFLRAYASFLNLDDEALLATLEGKATPTTFSAPGARPSSPSVKSGAGRAAPPENGVQPGETDSPQQVRPARPHNTPEAIFVEVGEKLRGQREMLELSLEDIERHTHLRQHYLEALEAGDLESLPSPVQGRGMLNNYATFLGMDPEPLMLRFAEGLQARLAARQAAQAPPRSRQQVRRRRPMPTPLRRLLSGDILIGGTLAILLFIFVAWGAIRIFATVSQQTPTATAPSIAEVLLATATPTISPTLPPTSAATPTSPIAPPLFPTQAQVTDATTGELQPPPRVGIQIYLTIRQRAWVRVTVDGLVELEDRVLPGSAYPFVGEGQVEVLTSNGAGVQLFYNGQDLGPMGRFGEDIDRIFTSQGVIAPTPTVPPIVPTGAATSTPPAPPTEGATPTSALQPTVPPLP